jgi:assimilatory nitrate reductase catalytic subunit
LRLSCFVASSVFRREQNRIRAELAWLDRPADWDAWVRSTFKVEPGAVLLSVRDERSGRHSFALFEDGKVVFAVYLSPEPVLVSRQWAVSLLADALPDASRRSEVLAGRPGSDMPDPGAIICACFSVGINTIIEAVTEGGCHSVDAIGAALKAGTNCGSCRAEIKGILATQQLTAAE